MKKITLNRETIRLLNSNEMAFARGADRPIENPVHIALNTKEACQGGGGGGGGGFSADCTNTCPTAVGEFTCHSCFSDCLACI